jgi:hypothetical protein
VEFRRCRWLLAIGHLGCRHERGWGAGDGIPRSLSRSMHATGIHWLMPLIVWSLSVAPEAATHKDDCQTALLIMIVKSMLFPVGPKFFESIHRQSPGESFRSAEKCVLQVSFAVDPPGVR